MKITSASKILLSTAGAMVLVAATLFVPSRAMAGGKKDAKAQQAAQPQIDLTKLVWPPAPDVGRIKYQAMYAGEDDLNPAAVKKHKSSWMDKMAGVSLPQEMGKPRLIAPYGVGFDSKGHIYVADAKNGAVFVFDIEGKKVNYLGAQKLKLPSGIAVDDADRIFVADSDAHIIFVFNTQGAVEAVFGAEMITRPVGLAIDNENRYLYVVDSLANRIAVFDADSFKLLRYIGQKPTVDNLAPGVMDRPNSVAVDSEGNVYVTDTFNARVQVFNADGEFVRMWGKPGNTAGCFMRPKGIAIDADDHVYVVDAEFNNVQVFTNEGAPLMFFGTRGLGPGTFTLATGIGIDRATNRVIVTEQWQGKMQMFTYLPDKDAAKEYEKLAQQRAEKEKEKAAAEKAAAAAPGK